MPRTNTAQSNNFDFNDLNRQSATLDLYNAPTSGEVHPEHVEYRPLVQRNGPDHFVEPEEQMEDQYNTLAYWFNLPEQGDFDVNGLPLALAATKQSAMQTKLPACNKAQAVVTRSPQFTQTSPDVRTEPTLPQSSIPFTGAYPQTLCVSQPTVNHDIPVVAAPVSQEAGFAGTTVLEIIVNELEEFLATHDELAIQEYLDTLPERLRERINTRLDEVRSRNLIAELDTLLDSGPVPKEPERDEVLEM